MTGGPAAPSGSAAPATRSGTCTATDIARIGAGSSTSRSSPVRTSRVPACPATPCCGRRLSRVGSRPQGIARPTRRGRSGHRGARWTSFVDLQIRTLTRRARLHGTPQDRPKSGRAHTARRIGLGDRRRSRGSRRPRTSTPRGGHTRRDTRRTRRPRRGVRVPLARPQRGASARRSRRSGSASERSSRARLDQLQPAGYTRLGAGIRGAAAILQRDSGTPNRLLLVLSDGHPYDDGYEGRYAEADVRRALEELRADGMGCLCLSIGAATDGESLRRVFGPASHAHAATLAELSPRMDELFLSALHELAAPRARR